MLRHLTILAWIHVVFGGGLLLLGLAILIGVFLERPYSSYAASFIVGMFFWFSTALFIPSLAGGLGLLRKKGWARFLIIGVSVEFLFAVPIGTALGAYGLWTLLHRETESIFAGQSAPQMPIGKRQKGILLAMLGVAAAFVLVLGGGFLLSRRPIAGIPMNGTFGAIAGLALVGIAFLLARLLGIPIGRIRLRRKPAVVAGQRGGPLASAAFRVSDDLKNAYASNPHMTITCPHLQPFEQAMRAAKIAVVPIFESCAKAHCRIHRPGLERQFALHEPVIYREFFEAERYMEDSPLARLLCTEDHSSWIEVLHPYVCNHSTPWFPAPPPA